MFSLVFRAKLANSVRRSSRPLSFLSHRSTPSVFSPTQLAPVSSSFSSSLLDLACLTVGPISGRRMWYQSSIVFFFFFLFPFFFLYRLQGAGQQATPHHYLGGLRGPFLHEHRGSISDDTNPDETCLLDYALISWKKPDRIEIHCGFPSTIVSDISIHPHELIETESAQKGTTPPYPGGQT